MVCLDSSIPRALTLLKVPSSFDPRLLSRIMIVESTSGKKSDGESFSCGSSFKIQLFNIAFSGYLVLGSCDVQRQISHPFLYQIVGRQNSGKSIVFINNPYSLFVRNRSFIVRIIVSTFRFPYDL